MNLSRKMNRCSLLVMLALLLAFNLRGQSKTYFDYPEMPDLVYWLPAPPDTLSAAFAHDIMRHMWGKKQRLDPVRAARAIRDASHSINTMSLVFSDAMGITISQQNTPAIYALLQRTMPTSSYVSYHGKTFYRRKRPYVRFNEPTLVPGHEASLAKEGSFPSGHTIVGWSTAMLLAEINPLCQDEILACGYDYAQSRIIAGYHWSSDVMAGYLAASTAVAKMHTHPEFLSDLEKARNEFKEKTSGFDRPKHAPHTKPFIPNTSNWLPAPPDKGTAEYVYDLSQYYEGMIKRQSTDAYTLALYDDCNNLETLTQTFGEQMDYEITPEASPAVYFMLKHAFSVMARTGTRMAFYDPRKRPFVQLNEASAMPEKDDSLRNITSYPCQHALLGWNFALLLVEVDPSIANRLLHLGYEIGQSQVTTGHNWQSDVDAGRLMAMAFYAFLHTDEDFLLLMKNARREFVNKNYSIPHTPHIGPGVNDKPQDKPEIDSTSVSATGRFTVDGLPATTRTRGVVIHDGKKVLNME